METSFKLSEDRIEQTVRDLLINPTFNNVDGGSIVYTAQQEMLQKIADSLAAQEQELVASFQQFALEMSAKITTTRQLRDEILREIGKQAAYQVKHTSRGRDQN